MKIIYYLSNNNFRAVVVCDGTNRAKEMFWNLFGWDSDFNEELRQRAADNKRKTLDELRVEIIGEAHLQDQERILCEEQLSN